MMFLNLDEQITEIATKSIGFTGAELDALNSTTNATAIYDGGTAIDQIELCAGVTPDVVNTTWIVDMYQTVADLAMNFFYIFLVLALITYILKGKDMLSASKEAEMVHLIKRSIIASFMIFNGLPILMTLLLMNQYVSEVFGGASSITELMVHSITSPFGAIVVAGGCGAIAWNAMFYLIRMILIFVSCAVWAIAWVLWIWDRTSVFAVFLLTIILVNIFLGAAMTLVYWVGTLAILAPEASTWWVDWGADVAGLVVMLISGLIPVIAFWFMIFNPTAMVKKTVYAVAKGV